jgi:NAD(P)H-flavin reductase
MAPMSKGATVAEPAISSPMSPRVFRIGRVRKETSDTFTMTLSSGAGFSFAPGQFNMLYAFGTGEVPISISGDPAKPETVVHTIRAVGTATRGLRALREGDSCGLRGPFGSSWPIEASYGSDLLLVAGGIGLAPLRPAVYRILAERNRFGKVSLIYGTRTPDMILYPRELERWRSRFDFQAEVTVDSGTGAWRGNVGVVTTLINRAMVNPGSTVAMVCGPEVMMYHTVMELRKNGVLPSRIYLSMERNMKCAIGFCGHCQFGGSFVCKDGPVFRYDRIAGIFGKREI